MKYVCLPILLCGMRVIVRANRRILHELFCFVVLYSAVYSATLYVTAHDIAAEQPDNLREDGGVSQGAGPGKQTGVHRKDPRNAVRRGFQPPRRECIATARVLAR